MTEKILFIPSHARGRDRSPPKRPVGQVPIVRSGRPPHEASFGVPDDIDERYVRMALTTIANRRRGALMRHRAAQRL